MMEASDPCELLRRTFGAGGGVRVVEVPGRVNLIGEHIDYHGLSVLPMAIGRRVRVAFRTREDRRIRAVSAGSYGEREFEWTPELRPVAPGDWENYVRAAAQAVGLQWGVGAGVDAAVVSDLPAAAGLSSSTALLVAFTLGLLERNPGFEALMEVLPEGEQFVGTRGGGMDHAAVLASRAGCASLIAFDPPSVRPVPVPASWGFLVAHSLEIAEKSGGAREEYNARRKAGSTALARLGFGSYRAALEGRSCEEAARLAGELPHEAEHDSFLHVVTEAWRVKQAVRAMEEDDAGRFGRLLVESHASLRDRLKVSCAALDRLVDAAMASGALGARLTGAGFGGCAVVFAPKTDLAGLRRKLMESFYSGRAEFVEERHLLTVEPAAGVLFAEEA